MALNITDSMVRQYQANIELVALQRKSALRNAVNSMTVTGKDFSIERLTNSNDTLTPVSSRHSATVISDPAHSRRVGLMSSFNFAFGLDNEDLIRMLADPASSYIAELAGQFNRTLDEHLITQLLGDAKTGETGSSTQALPAGQQIAHGSAGLTLTKLKQARTLFLQNHVDLDMEEVSLATNAEGLEDLSTDSGVVSIDNVNFKVNESGRLGMLAGFRILPAERITSYTGTSAASSNRPAIAFTKSALMLGLGQDMKVKVSDRADLNHMQQMHISSTYGAVRVHDEKVVDIRFQE